MDLSKVDIAFNKMKSCAESLHWYLNIFINKQDALNNLNINDYYKDVKFLEKLSKNEKQLTFFIEEINRLIVINNALDLNEISSHYKTFLLNEIINYNWNNLSYLDDRYVRIINELIDKTCEGQFEYTQNDHNAISALKWMLDYYEQHLTIFHNKIAAVNIFNKIKDIKNNIVLIGANGSGKSTFARNLKGKLSDNTTILSAQHLLIYKKHETISTTNKETEMVYDFQSSDKLGSDPNLVNLFSNDFNNLIGALFNENSDRERGYYLDKEERKDSLLIKVIGIWQSLIEHRKLRYDKSSIEVLTNDGYVYDFNYLSDGEKAVFYYIAHVLLAREDSYIIVDEPESHLHLAICNKLWDILEQERKDCKFIYLTHNLDFATTRNNKTLLWNKQFVPPAEWDVSKLENDEYIPERLLMEIVGSRKNILFCEGNDKTSLDFKLYSILFNNYTIIPVGGHINVINYCRAYNRNKAIYGLQAIGIIDRDCHEDREIEVWERDKIYTLPINEIENLLCDEIILKSAIKRFCCKEEVLDQFKDKFFNKLGSDKSRQAVWYTNNIINNRLKSNMLKEERNLDSLIKELNDSINEEQVNTLYENKLQELNDLIERKEYDEALKVSNFKGALINELPRLIVDNYKEKVFVLIADDEELKKSILAKYFYMIL